MTSQLEREAREAAAGARRQIATCAAPLAELGHRLRATPPPFVVTCARGSSDHAATYGKYVLETTVDRIVASVGPSVASLYDRTPRGLAGALFIAVSQSGRSPDLLELTDTARRAGALVVGLLNDPTAPLADRCDVVVPLCAGPELAIAATKSVLLAGLAFVQLAAAWSQAPELHAAVAQLPDALEAARALDWAPAFAALAGAHDLYVLGRGLGLGAAQELALKLKETCRLHAEAFSTAEVLHGPLALVGPGFPIVALGHAGDPTEASMRATLARLVALGAGVISTLDVDGAVTLPTLDVPAILAPLVHLQAAYLALPSLATCRGLDADLPLHLTKVTHTR